jgi:hypothetical protein
MDWLVGGVNTMRFMSGVEMTWLVDGVELVAVVGFGDSWSSIPKSLSGVGPRISASKACS